MSVCFYDPFIWSLIKPWYAIDPVYQHTKSLNLRSHQGLFLSFIVTLLCVEAKKKILERGNWERKDQKGKKKKTKLKSK